MDRSSPARTAREVFDQAHEIASPEERRAYLDEACAGDPEVRQKVEALLQALDEAGSRFLAQPALPPSDTGPYQPGNDTSEHVPADLPQTVDHPSRVKPAAGEGAGAQVGPYRLIEKLGEGGMGVVWLAEQTHPLRRRVALKIIRADRDSGHVVARFEAERQALTRMDHVNIARVLDAGATDKGVPFFVMELVQGVPLARFCDEHTMTVPERLLLFVTVCQAVQHAHQKGIIHRDLKPSNVLVALHEGKPLAKVIDFGLARAVEQPLTDQSALTQVGSIVGTLAYMSPEQADFNNPGVDTRADIFSLGVMLYELLTGVTPFDAGRQPTEQLHDWLRRIHEEEPLRPSAWIAARRDRLADVARQRQTDPVRLARTVRGELDWIVLKALQKNRDRRYETANALASDVQRYLDDEPVEACPPSLRYQLGKSARKHWKVLGVAAGFVALLGLGLVVVNDARQKAVREREVALRAEKEIRKALVLSWAGIRAQVRSGSKPAEAEKVVLVNMLEGYRLVLTDLLDFPELRATRAEAEFHAASLNALLGRSAEAEAGYQRAIGLYENLSQEFAGEAEFPSELARSLFDLGSLLKEQGRPVEAEAAYRRSIEWFNKVSAAFPDEPAYRRELADAYNDLGVLLRDKQQFARAEQAFREAVALGVQVVAEVPSIPQYQINLAAGYHNLGNTVRDQSNAGAALPWYGKAIALLDSLQPRPTDAVIYLRNAHWDRANALGQLGRHADASQDWQKALALEGDGSDRDSLRLFWDASEMETKLQAESRPSAALLYEAATKHARATTAAVATKEASLQQQHARRALERLQQVRAAGWFRDPKHVQQVRQEKSFASLPPADFKAFLDSLLPGPAPNRPAPK